MTESTPVPELSRYLSPQEAADYLRMSLSWLRKATRAGKLPRITLGWRIVYDRVDLDAFVAERKQAAAWDAWDARPRRRARRAPTTGKGAQGDAA